MYTKLESQIKASQKAYECRHHGRPFRSKPISFEDYVLQGIRKYEAKGAEFTLMEPGIIKIQWPGRTPILRTVQDLYREYESNYLSKIPA